MKPINLLAAATALVMASTPAFAANWIWVGESVSNSVYYFDADTIQSSGNKVTAWSKVDHSRDKTKKMRQSLSRDRYDCSERTSTALNNTFYYPDGKVNSVTWETYEQKAEPVIPDSVWEDMLESVCVLPADANAIPLG